jgi:hypothetical protein
MLGPSEGISGGYRQTTRELHIDDRFAGEKLTINNNHQYGSPVSPSTDRQVHIKDKGHSALAFTIRKRRS